MIFSNLLFPQLQLCSVLLRLLSEKLKSPYLERNLQEYTRLSFNTYFFDACSLIRPTPGPKVVVTLRDLRRLLVTLGKFAQNVMQFKAVLGDF